MDKYNLLGFTVHNGDNVRIKKDGRLATVIKSYCLMGGWCDEFRVGVRYLDDNSEGDFPTCGVEVV